MSQKTIKKTIFITGASSGIGKALALSYAKEGHHLILNGRDQVRLDNVTRRCIEKGATVSAKVIDVTDQKAMAEWLLNEAAYTPIDLVIANAGISGGTAGLETGCFMPQIRKIYDVNVMGVLNTLEPIVEDMIKRGSGQIALMSSMASYAPYPGAPAYASAKTAIRYLGHSLRGTLAPHGVKVSVICPGFIESRITDKNDFPMPFFKKSDYAAQKIMKGLKRNKMTIAFPLPMYILSAILGILPNNFLLFINLRIPKKSSI